MGYDAPMPQWTCKAWLLVVSLAATLCVAGCPAGVTAPPEAQPSPPRATPAETRLRAESDELASENAQLRIRLDEMSRRERRLAEEVTRLRRLNAALDKQVRALAAVPLERDAWKARFERLTHEAAELKRRLGEQAETVPTTVAAPADSND